MEKSYIVILLFSIGIIGYSTTLDFGPADTADVLGSYDITLECSSTYTQSGIVWYFAQLGPKNNMSFTRIATIRNVTQGYEDLFKTSQPTPYANNLIVKQLSNKTAGLYRCSFNYYNPAVRLDYSLNVFYDANLLSIPFPFTIEPSYGPIAGGTNITITGIDFDSLLSAVRTDVDGSIYSAGIGVYTTITKLSYNSLVVTTPITTNTSIGQSMPLTIVFPPWPYNVRMDNSTFYLTLRRNFTYKSNPEITAIYPIDFVIRGGIILEVYGTDLSSVAKPLIKMTIVIKRLNESSSTSYISIEPCTLQPGNGSLMLCPLPSLVIPDDFLNGSRNSHGNYSYQPPIVKRESSLRQSQALDHPLLLSRHKRDDRCAIYAISQNYSVSIYIGFILDGYTKYEDISKFFPNFPQHISMLPDIKFLKDVIEFDPWNNEYIYIKGKNMEIVCNMADYVVRVGHAICRNVELHDNQLTCALPMTSPNQAEEDTLLCGSNLAVIVYLGPTTTHYACLKYVSSNALGLIVGLTVGLSSVAIIVIIVVAVICQRRIKKAKLQPTTTNISTQSPLGKSQHSDGTKAQPRHHNKNGYLQERQIYANQISNAGDDGYLRQQQLDHNDGYLQQMEI